MFVRQTYFSGTESILFFSIFLENNHGNKIKSPVKSIIFVKFCTSQPNYTWSNNLSTVHFILKKENLKIKNQKKKTLDTHLYYYKNQYVICFGTKKEIENGVEHNVCWEIISRAAQKIRFGGRDDSEAESGLSIIIFDTILISVLIDFYTAPPYE